MSAPAPRWSLALCCSLIAALCGWAATVLPWRSWTTFAILTALVGLVHAVTAVLALLGKPARVRAWRIQAMVALGYLAYLTWNLVGSASTIAAVYGGLGRGVAVSLALVWCIAAFVTVPLSAWGIACSGGIGARRRAIATSGLAVLALLVGGWTSHRAAIASPVGATTLDSQAAVGDAISQVLPRPRLPAATPSLMSTSPASCPSPPAEAGTTILVTHRSRRDPEAAAQTECIQAASFAAALDQLAGVVGDDVTAIDVVRGLDPLEHVAPVVDGMLLRPGLDGVCDGSECLAPWQLLASDVFTVSKPLPVVPELRFGFDPRALRRMLGTAKGKPPGVDGLVRIETHAYVTDDAGVLHALSRMREDDGPLDAASLRAAKRAAEQYILGAQGDDGRFEYRIDPFAHKVSYAGFSLARQAGTSLVICELAEDRERAREVATAALAMLTSTARVDGDLAALAYPVEKEFREIGLGDTALSSIALLSCRDLVGDRFDADIARMTRFLLRMQRDDGGFYPRYDMQTHRPVPGPDPLYAVGQAVFALTLLETLTDAGGVTVELPDHDQVRAAVERAMSYTAHDYWDLFAADFFFMEENWHCLAARAALGHHRHEAYEQFCLDYVQYKRRLILDEHSDVVSDLVGGYGFGNVILPHTTGSSGFGEAMAAAMAIKRARGLPLEQDQAAMTLALRFLLHHQWDEVNDFAVDAPHPVVGGFSEHMGSPHIRIDYVQHAMAAMGHGGRQLGLLEGV